MDRITRKSILWNNKTVLEVRTINLRDPILEEHNHPRIRMWYQESSRQIWKKQSNNLCFESSISHRELEGEIK